MSGGLLDAAASLFLGAACPGCGLPSAALCAACRAVLADADLPAVPGQGLAVVAASAYAGVWRATLVALKERHCWSLAAPLGQALALATAAALREAGVRPEGIRLVPMPSTPAAVRERGQDTTRLLARNAARALSAAGLAARVEPCLSHARAVFDQSGLRVGDRDANLAGALVARPGPGGGVRVVVDDLTTTGASLREAARALAAAGAPPAAAAIVAAATRRDGRVRVHTRPSGRSS